MAVKRKMLMKAMEQKRQQLKKMKQTMSMKVRKNTGQKKMISLIHNGLKECWKLRKRK